MSLRNRAAKAQIQLSREQLRQMHPETPRFLPAYGPLSRFIAAMRRRKARKG